MLLDVSREIGRAADVLASDLAAGRELAMEVVDRQDLQMQWHQRRAEAGLDDLLLARRRLVQFHAGALEMLRHDGETVDVLLHLWLRERQAPQRERFAEAHARFAE